MRRRTRAAAAAAAAIAALAALGVPASADDPLDVHGTAVGVAEREFRITAYRRAVRPGQVKLNVKNFGEDVHDLVVFSPRGRTLGSTGEIRSGGQAVLRVRLSKPGSYRLVCMQAGHARRGMKATLAVRAKLRGR